MRSCLAADLAGIPGGFGLGAGLGTEQVLSCSESLVESLPTVLAPSAAKPVDNASLFEEVYGGGLPGNGINFDAVSMAHAMQIAPLRRTINWLFRQAELSAAASTQKTAGQLTSTVRNNTVMKFLQFFRYTMSSQFNFACLNDASAAGLGRLTNALFDAENAGNFHLWVLGRDHAKGPYKKSSVSSMFSAILRVARAWELSNTGAQVIFEVFVPRILCRF